MPFRVYLCTLVTARGRILASFRVSARSSAAAEARARYLCPPEPGETYRIREC